MDNMTLKNRLRIIRAEKGIQQSKLAESVHVSRQTIAAIEQHKICPNAKLALEICHELDMTFEEVFYLEKEGT